MHESTSKPKGTFKSRAFFLLMLCWVELLRLSWVQWAGNRTESLNKPPADADDARAAVRCIPTNTGSNCYGCRAFNGLEIGQGAYINRNPADAHDARAALA